MIAILPVSESALSLARQIQLVLNDAIIYYNRSVPGCKQITSIRSFCNEHFADCEAIVFIGAMGICVRSIVPYIQNKYEDPAVVCVDTTGRFVIPVLSGHVGGANILTRQIAREIGGEPVITTQSDNLGLWSIDRWMQDYGWRCQANHYAMNKAISAFVALQPTTLLVEVQDAGIDELLRTKPSHVTVCRHIAEVDWQTTALLLVVSPFIHDEIERTTCQVIQFFPPVLHVGVGCRRDCRTEGVADYIVEQLHHAGLSIHAVSTLNTIELKRHEPLMAALAAEWSWTRMIVYETEDLSEVEVPNPSEKVHEVTGIWGVAESAALKSSHNGRLLLEKQKVTLEEGRQFTFAVAMTRESELSQGGHIEIVGAGPGDPELVSVRGKRFLQQADLILYAGSLVPVELTYYAKPGAVVRSSATMNLEEQFQCMKEFYDRGKLVVRLHTGDPCIYGAIQEQMAFFDKYKMDYHITPGISSFQAAAAALRSQFTIPERVQTIILTRGEGRTPMPEKEQLHKLAQSQSTMCIYLSASIVERVQEELLQAYPPETPVAACYKLTWKDEKIYRGQLKDLARLVRENNLTLTTLLVVGDAIDNRQGFSKLYDKGFSHMFRTKVSE